MKVYGLGVANNVQELHFILKGEGADAVLVLEKKKIQNRQSKKPERDGNGEMRREIEIVLRGAKSMAEAEKAGQAEHSLSDINPVVVFFFFFFLIGIPRSLDTYLILQTVGEKQKETEKIHQWYTSDIVYTVYAAHGKIKEKKHFGAGCCRHWFTPVKNHKNVKKLISFTMDKKTMSKLTLTGHY